MMAAPAFAQMQWSSYDASGNLVTANIATGGDTASGTSVTFTIPANTQLSFATKSFTPFSLAGASASKSVGFNVSVSAGLGGVAQRTLGWPRLVVSYPEGVTSCGDRRCDATPSG